MFSGGIEMENWLKWIIFATKTIRLNDIFRGIEKRCEKTGLNFLQEAWRQTGSIYSICLLILKQILDRIFQLQT